MHPLGNSLKELKKPYKHSDIRLAELEEALDDLMRWKKKAIIQIETLKGKVFALENKREYA